jgi:hypothetical protein
LERAGGESPHIHPWYFYLERIGWFHPARSPVWSEGLIVILALVGVIFSLGRRDRPLPILVATYTILLTGIYSVISYKTPWCLLGFFHGMILLAGFGAAALVEICRPRILKAMTIIVLGLLTLQLGWQAWRGNFQYAADPRNPYVYVQTSPGLLPLIERVEGIARVSPQGFDTVIKVMAPDNDYWPVPWYLRRFQHVGWYERMPEDPFSPIMLVSTDFKVRLDDVSDRKWIMAGIYDLRPGKFFELYVELELWKDFVATLPPPED